MGSQDDISGRAPRCANCGAALEGPFCGQCGQSIEEIRRPAWALITDFTGDVFVWDGRFLSTLRALLRGPGRLARSYADGQRARWTPPIRLYLLISLAFFAAMSLAGVRPIAVDLSPDADTIRNQSAGDIAARQASIAAYAATYAPDSAPMSCGVLPGSDEITADGRLVFARDTDIAITPMRWGQAPESRVIDDATQACLEGDIQALGLSSAFADLVITALRDPAGFEARASAAAAQALVLMVVALALLNLLLHPRRTLIEHVILSLYFHALLLPGFAGVLLLGYLAAGISAAIGLPLAVAAIIAVAGLIWISDRQFYGSSWYGALLRLPIQLAGYSAAITAAIFALMFLPLL